MIDGALRTLIFIGGVICVGIAASAPHIDVVFCGAAGAGIAFGYLAATGDF